MYEVATLCLQRYKKYDNVENPHMLFMQRGTCADVDMSSKH